MHPDLSTVLFSEQDLVSRINELGRELAIEYADKRPIIVTTLKGSAIFMCDLVRCIHPVPDKLQIEFIKASSYDGEDKTESSGRVDISMCTMDGTMKGRHLLIVEDIVDTGRTGLALMKYMQQHYSPASVKMVSLLSKPARRQVTFEPDWLGFTIEDVFVVGYGLDYDQSYRSLPYIGILAPK